MNSHERKDYNLDPGTIGGTEAAHILCEILSKPLNKHYVRPILARLGAYNKLLNAVATIESRPAREHLMSLVRDEGIRKMKESANFGLYEYYGFASYLLNVMEASHRKHLRHEYRRD